MKDQKSLIATLLIASFFLTLILIAVILLVFYIRNWTQRRDDFYVKRIGELNGQIENIKSLFKNEITNVLNLITNVIKPKDKE